jgi:hypothetical protein
MTHEGLQTRRADPDKEAKKADKAAPPKIAQSHYSEHRFLSSGKAYKTEEVPLSRKNWFDQGCIPNFSQR